MEIIPLRRPPKLVPPAKPDRKLRFVETHILSPLKRFVVREELNYGRMLRRADGFVFRIGPTNLFLQENFWYLEEPALERETVLAVQELLPDGHGCTDLYASADEAGMLYLLGGYTRAPRFGQFWAYLVDAADPAHRYTAYVRTDSDPEARDARLFALTGYWMKQDLVIDAHEINLLRPAYGAKERFVTAQ